MLSRCSEPLMPLGSCCLRGGLLPLMLLRSYMVQEIFFREMNLFQAAVRALGG